MADATYSIDEALKTRIRNRIGKSEAFIEVREEHINLGFCETCDYPVDGFSVYADGELVWPSTEYLSEFGGLADLDEEGLVRGSSLSTYGQFDNWLNGRPFEGD